MFKVERRHRVPIRGRVGAPRRAGVQQAHVTDVGGRGRRPGGLDRRPGRARPRGTRTAERVQGADLLDGHGSADAVPMTATSKVDKAALQALLQREGSRAMTRAIDCLVNVDFADRDMPDWMVRVKEDYFKGGDSFFKSPELSELLDDMDAHGVERAILMSNVGAHEGRAISFVEARPDRFALGGRRVQPAAADEGARQARVVRARPPGRVRERRPELLGRRHVPAERRGLLPALHEVLRARPAAVHEHGHPRAAAAGRAAEPDPPRPGVHPVPGARSSA